MFEHHGKKNGGYRREGEEEEEEEEEESLEEEEEEGVGRGGVGGCGHLECGKALHGHVTVPPGRIWANLVGDIVQAAKPARSSTANGEGRTRAGGS